MFYSIHRRAVATGLCALSTVLFPEFSSDFVRPNHSRLLRINHVDILRINIVNFIINYNEYCMSSRAENNVHLALMLFCWRCHLNGCDKILQFGFCCYCCNIDWLSEKRIVYWSMWLSMPALRERASNAMNALFLLYSFVFFRREQLNECVHCIQCLHVYKHTVRKRHRRTLAAITITKLLRFVGNFRYCVNG